ncbi:hypothetical protein TNCV_237521 [Trichonephila clavipes]|nr:hypothetical protein TNCV_237521 [Trichonephila clavipes]
MTGDKGTKSSEFSDSECNSDDDFGSEYRLDISDSDCSDFGTSETESDSDSESLSAARQWCELNTDTPNPAPPEFIFQGDPELKGIFLEV